MLRLRETSTNHESSRDFLCYLTRFIRQRLVARYAAIFIVARAYVALIDAFWRRPARRKRWLHEARFKGQLFGSSDGKTVIVRVVHAPVKRFVFAFRD